VQPNTVESGSRLADRYRLEELLKAEDGFTTWRAVDEKLSRYVGVHVLPAAHPRAKSVVQAAQAAAMLYDGRFCQVLDASQQADVIYVVEECLRGTYLAEQLSGGPLPAAEAAKLTKEVAGALAAAHEAGLAHLRLHPENVLRTETGQIKVFGLAVEAALYGAESDDPAATDARGIGALLYACLTARWPDGAGFGLAAAPVENGAVCSPRQVRAGVPAALDDIAMRALTGRGSGHGHEPLRSPAEVSAALATVPRLKPEMSEAATQLSPRLDATAARAYEPAPGYPPAAGYAPPAPTGRSRIGKALSGLVALLVLAGVVLFGISLANNALSNGGNGGENPGGQSPAAAGTPIAVKDIKDFDPGGNPPDENPREVDNAIDGDPDTYWKTNWYKRENLGGLKEGVGVILDLGSVQQVGAVNLKLYSNGTSLQVRAADESADQAPGSADDFTTVAKADDAGSSAELKLQQPRKTRYLLIWLTSLPETEEPNDGGPYRGGIADVAVTS
jgi:serine/threonine protein kinase